MSDDQNSPRNRNGPSPEAMDTIPLAGTHKSASV